VLRGKLAAISELGIGFNPVLSGRENIFHNAALLGLSRDETLGMLGQIIEFSELEEFIDAPVFTYSSGCGRASATRWRPISTLTPC
jgi:lipopolysaccharide transport system ATP-binding protein